jgi:hypothetical protein
VFWDSVKFWLARHLVGFVWAVTPLVLFCLVILYWHWKADRRLARRARRRRAERPDDVSAVEGDGDGSARD